MLTNKRNHHAMFAVLFLLQIIASCSSATLSTKSRWIVDAATGKRVKLTCVNWPSHLEPMIAEGLEKKPLNYIVKKIKETGFNCVRLTWPTYMFTRPEYGNLTVSKSLDKLSLHAAKEGIAKNNPRFLTMNVVQLHKAVVNELGKNKVMVVLDNHISLPSWCCSDNDSNGFFGDVNFFLDEWLYGLAAVARAYKGNPAVVGMSLRNELRGSRQNEVDWYTYMQQGANTIHQENPHLLVIVSGFNFAGNLGFLKSKPMVVNFRKKLVFEAHWYPFGISAEQWAAQTNQFCAQVTQTARDNYFFLTQGGNNNSFPLFLSEFGINLSGDNEADNRYIGCLLAALAETDVDWALWGLQGSYMLREGRVNYEELYGVLDFNWDRPRSPTFLHRLQLVRHINQDFKSKHATHYKMFHPLSGQCVKIVKKGIVLGDCKKSSLWAQHQDFGPIKHAWSPRCLGVVGDGATPRFSKDCSTKWKSVSSTGLHLAAIDGKDELLCLEKNASDSTLVTKKCLCVGDDLADLPSCADNPQSQWFKFVPTNIW